MRYHASTSILLAAALLTPQVVLAQENTDDTAAELEVAEAETAPAETEGRRLGTVTVTAQKRETSLQSTPVAISAFEGETLEERGIDDLANLQSYIPNLHVGEEQGQFKISLRGIGLQGTSTISDSGVAFYIDGNYIARPIGGTATFHDIERIEVLRGPQGHRRGGECHLQAADRRVRGQRRRQRRLARFLRSARRAERAGQRHCGDALFRPLQ